MKKIKKKDQTLTVFRVSFECPQGHPIEVEYLHFGPTRNMLADVDRADFAMYCLPCKWQGMKCGDRRISLRRVESNREKR